MKIVLVLVFILLPWVLWAQPPDTVWTRSFDWPGSNCTCYSVLPMADGGCVFAANYFATDSARLMLVRMDSSGNTAWTRVYSAQLLRCRTLLRAENGDFFLTGSIIERRSDPYRAWVMRTDSAGDSLWSQTYSVGTEDNGLGACLLSNGDIALGGETYSARIDDHAAALWRINPQGDVVWSWSADTTAAGDGSLINAVAAGPLGGIVTAGQANHFFGYEHNYEFADAWSQSWQSNAQIANSWSGRLKDMDQYFAVSPLSDGGHLFAGISENDYSSYGYLLLAKQNGAGAMQWNHITAFGRVRGVYAVHAVSGIYVVVSTVAGVTDGVPHFSAFNARGDSLWTSTYEWQPTAGPVASAVTVDGGLVTVVCSSSYSPPTAFVHITRYAPFPPQTTVCVGPPFVEFNEVAVGGTAHDTVQIVNTDMVSVTITAVSVSGSFACDVTLPQTLAAHEYWNIPVRFTPLAPGDATGEVRVTATAASPPAGVHLHGRGIDAPPVEWFFDSHPASPRFAGPRSVAALELSGIPRYALVESGTSGVLPYQRVAVVTFGPAGDSSGFYTYTGPDSTDCTPLAASSVGDTLLICERASTRMLHAIAADGTTLWRTNIQPVLSYPPTISAVLPLAAGDGYLVACRTEFSGSPTMCSPLLIRTTGSGDTLWTREVSALRGSWCTAVKELPDGWLIAGPNHTWPIDGGGFFMARLTTLGDTVWSRHYRAPHALREGACFAADGSVLFFGEDSVSNRLADAFLVRAAANGDSLWARHFGGDGADRCHCATATPDGGFVIGGETGSLGPQDGASNMWLWKVSGDGDSLWSEPLSLKHSWESCTAIQTTSDGGLIACGTALTPVFTDSSYTIFVDALIYKLSPVIAASTQPRPTGAPREYRLSQNYPNPFNPTTEIRFDLPEAVRVELKVFNILGQEVAKLVDDVRPAGAYSVMWDSKSNSEMTIASGIYIYQLKAGKFTDSKKMILIR